MMTDKPVLLAVLAHPDDESFGMGGTLAYYASRGVEVHLVCATRGEVGEADEKHMKGFSSVGEMREAELRCAAGILGLAGVHFLDYRDSGMPNTPDNRHPRALAAQPLDEVAAKVIRYIRELQPQVVITFDPIGGYRHPDHIAIHKASVCAFEQAANPGFTPVDPGFYQPRKLYFHIFPHRMLRFAIRFLPLVGKDLHKWGRNGDIDLTELAVEDFPIHAVIDYRPVAEKKARAAACHASQGGTEMASGITALVMRMFSSRENYMRAYPPFRRDEKKEKDLFANL
jgi:LmbE family N-acetylglucosaminyl deacetylase